MEPTVQQIDTKEVKVKKKPKNSQKTLVIILLVCLILSLGGLTYFLIKDEILQIPFVNTKIEEEEKVTEDQTEPKGFSISYSTDPDSIKYYLKTILPEGAEILGEDTTSTKIEFSNSYLKFMISHIAVPETVKSYVDIDDGKLLSLFRVVDQSDHIYYTGNLRTDEDCVEVGAVAPCGSLAVELDNGNNETVYINVEFVGDDEDLTIADEIVANLEFVNEQESESEENVSETSGEDATEDWLTYYLNSPSVSFKYPSGMTVTIVPTDDDQYTHLQISGARESFNYYMFYGEGGPGSGTFGEIESPESLTMIGEFLGEDVYEIKNGESYKYFSYIDKCETCLEKDGYSPSCPCTSSDNYVYNDMFTKDLKWYADGIQETYITIELKWTMSDYDKKIYENILLSFEAL
ncbi:MAG: hypothetical protein PHP08_04110 [Candidatus Dojkabacteria bacterium]|nr:hypothetical protein [Candidatus Dojkabacteria bacterium]